MMNILKKDKNKPTIERLKMNRKQIKEKARQRIKENYWKCVLASILLAFTLGTTGFSTFASYTNDDFMDGIIKQIMYDNTLLALVLSISASAFVFAFLVHIFLIRPLYAGCRNFFLINNSEKAPLNEIKSGFFKNYNNIVKTFFIHDCFILLWSCLLIIPGIIKTYSYQMMPFLLAENPDLPPLEAIQKSREMMDGYKWQAFLLDLSFIGWEILSVLSFGIIGIFWTQPYMYQADAQLYEELKNLDQKEPQIQYA